MLGGMPALPVTEPKIDEAVFGIFPLPGLLRRSGGELRGESFVNHIERALG
ncbi:MAG: hypothetical protein JWP98_1169 [Edaphobacter sp.]|nr:hypothetical protein [Edaphobacter sp.]